PVWPALQVVGSLVHERRAVADSLADRPPVGGVGMRWMLDSDAPEPVQRVPVAYVAVPELVQVRIVEAQRSGGPVHLDEEVTRPARARARHLEGSARTGREARENR